MKSGVKAISEGVADLDAGARWPFVLPDGHGLGYVYMSRLQLMHAKVLNKCKVNMHWLHNLLAQ